jgi:hypothetical protein
MIEEPFSPENIIKSTLQANIIKYVSFLDTLILDIKKIDNDAVKNLLNISSNDNNAWSCHEWYCELNQNFNKLREKLIGN